MPEASEGIGDFFHVLARYRVMPITSGDVRYRPSFSENEHEEHYKRGYFRPETRTGDESHFFAVLLAEERRFALDRQVN
jgi:hypothetical protein